MANSKSKLWNEDDHVWDLLETTVWIWRCGSLNRHTEKMGFHASQWRTNMMPRSWDDPLWLSLIRGWERVNLCVFMWIRHRRRCDPITWSLKWMWFQWDWELKAAFWQYSQPSWWAVLSAEGTWVGITASTRPVSVVLSTWGVAWRGCRDSSWTLTPWLREFHVLGKCDSWRPTAAWFSRVWGSCFCPGSCDKIT